MWRITTIWREQAPCLVMCLRCSPHCCAWMPTSRWSIWRMPGGAPPSMCAPTWIRPIRWSPRSPRTRRGDWTPSGTPPTPRAGPSGQTAPRAGTRDEKTGTVRYDKDRAARQVIADASVACPSPPTGPIKAVALLREHLAMAVTGLRGGCFPSPSSRLNAAAPATSSIVP